MEITITGCRYAPKWETLQKLLREATNKHDGLLTRISRKDRGCDYRAIGDYDLDFKDGDTVMEISLHVKP